MDPRITLFPRERLEVESLFELRGRSGMGDRRIKDLVEAHGSASRALGALGRQGDFLDPRRKEAPISSWLEEGFGVLPMTSSRYPAPLSELTDPPPLLFLKGRWELLAGTAVAIVGSRRASEVGRRAAETMGRVLGEAGVTVVSGMALGIDGAAHRGALQVGGNTVAVLGSGFRVVYPGAHRPLFREISQKGLVVSEFLPNEPALPHHFPKRNRIIAALAQAVVVVEAGGKSGALITVDHGLDLGRDILVMPGSVENAQAVGSNRLLREGAHPIPAPERILEELRELGLVPDKTKLVDSGAGVVPPRLPADQQALWTALSQEPAGVDEVAARASLSVSRALSGLSALELGGWARRCPGMRFQRGQIQGGDR